MTTIYFLLTIYHPWIKYWGHKDQDKDPQLKKLLIVIQILLLNTLGNIWKTVRRMCILMLGCKGLSWEGQARKRGFCTNPLHKGWTSHKMVSLSGYKLGLFFFLGGGRVWWGAFWSTNTCEFRNILAITPELFNQI